MMNPRSEGLCNLITWGLYTTLLEANNNTEKISAEE